MPGEKEKKIEPKKLTEAELITMEEKSRMEHEHTMNIMEHKVKLYLKLRIGLNMFLTIRD